MGEGQGHSKTQAGGFLQDHRDTFADQAAAPVCGAAAGPPGIGTTSLVQTVKADAQAEGYWNSDEIMLVRSPAQRPASDRGGQHRCNTHGGAEPHPDPLGVQKSVGAGATGAGGCGATASPAFWN